MVNLNFHKVFEVTRDYLADKVTVILKIISCEYFNSIFLCIFKIQRGNIYEEPRWYRIEKMLVVGYYTHFF